MQKIIDYKMIEYPQLWEKIFKVRFEVFVKEQSVPIELERDEFDKKSYHMAVIENDIVIGTLRVYIDNKKAKIGRVALIKEKRGQEIGKEMMKRAIEFSKMKKVQKIVLDSQTYIEKFYSDLGFISYGDIFMDAGIPHIHMELEL